MVIGIIDVGSNSIKLLIAESGSTLAMRYEKTWETRISAGISRNRPFLDEVAMFKGIQAIRELIAEAEPFSPDEFRLVATSAVRDASNRQEFTDQILEATGYRLRVLSGQEEAEYIGHGIMTDPDLVGVDTFSLVDLGGGSLECIQIVDRKVVDRVSLPLGAVRLSEQCLKSTERPMESHEVRSIANMVRSTVEESGFRFAPKGAPLIGTGGALTVARRIRSAWLGTDFEAVGNQLSVDFLNYLFLELASLRLRERARIPHLPKERADIMPAALMTLITICNIVGARVYRHSLHNLRYGIAAEIHEQRQPSQKGKPTPTLWTNRRPFE